MTEKEIKQIWSFPLKDKSFDEVGLNSVYVSDSKSHVVFNWTCNLTSEEKANIVSLINGETVDSNLLDKLSEIEVTRDETHVKFNGQNILLMRSWGYLTGIGGLAMNSDDAIEAQDAMLDYVVKCLKVEKNGK